MSVATAEALLEAYQSVKPSGLTYRVGKEKKTAKAWLPPLQSWFKVNIGATIRKEKNLSGLGAVIRDAMGNIIAAAVKTSRFHGNVSYAEAEAVRWGLQAAVDAGLTSLIIETDSQMVADLINNRKGSKNEIYWVILEIQNKFKNLRNVKCHYTPRSCNAIAHSLVRLAFDHLEADVWLGSFSIEIMNVFNSLV